MTDKIGVFCICMHWWVQQPTTRLLPGVLFSIHFLRIHDYSHAYNEHFCGRCYWFYKVFVGDFIIFGDWRLQEVRVVYGPCDSVVVVQATTSYHLNNHIPGFFSLSVRIEAHSRLTHLKVDSCALVCHSQLVHDPVHLSLHRTRLT